jgi:opacity protein-like surface antigen
MRLVPYRYIVLALLLTIPTPALAQRASPGARVPAEGSMAAGGEAGFIASGDDDLTPSFIVGGFFEYYFTPRLSLRPSVTFLDAGFDDENDDSLRQTRLGADVIYNWERGKWHPFAGGGLGVHSLRLKDNGRAFGDTANQFGLTALGGAEYFFNRRTSLKFEGRAMFVDDAFGLDPGGFAGTVGVKRYF